MEQKTREQFLLSCEKLKNAKLCDYIAYLENHLKDNDDFKKCDYCGQLFFAQDLSTDIWSDGFCCDAEKCQNEMNQEIIQNEWERDNLNNIRCDRPYGSK